MHAIMTKNFNTKPARKNADIAAKLNAQQNKYTDAVSCSWLRGIDGLHAVTVMLIVELFIIGFVVVESIDSKLNSSSKFICLKIYINI